MHKNTVYWNSKLLAISMLTVACLCTSLTAEDGWQRKEVDWSMPNGSRIRAIKYPTQQPPPVLSDHRPSQPMFRPAQTQPSGLSAQADTTSGPIMANIIDSPPLDGFIPWIVVAVTNENSGWDYNGYPASSVVGSYLTGSPQSDYAIGIYDTGASANLISDDDAIKTGMVDHGLVTTLPVELLGATGSAFAYTSDSLSLFIGGLDNLDENGLLTDDSALLGETNVSAIVGDPIDSPNLPTAIGAPMTVFVTSAFCNNNELSINIDGNDFNTPYIDFFSLDDSLIPSYSNIIDIVMLPSGAAVQYFPCELLGLCGSEPDGTPAFPSTIWGSLLSSQSLYFMPWVNVADGNDAINNLDDFMLDTGAQITVISKIVAAGLHLNTTDSNLPNGPEFWVEIQDVTGQITMEPGFYLDSLDIPAEGQWLEYTNVPVVAINVGSPAGGTLDGIIGMNLFVDLNFVITGGGMEGQGYNAVLEFEAACHIAGDIAGDCYDCTVDFQDLDLIAEHWLETTASPNWNPQCDIAPESAPDGKIDALDFTVMAGNWMQTGP